MASNPSLNSMEKLSIISTVTMVVLLALLAWASTHNNWLFWLAASVGAIGGLVHEIAQSGGKIMFFQREEDGTYLGSLAGAILGAVAGILVARGDLLAAGAETALTVTKTQLTYEVFMAGLALKGVTEAAGGNPVPKKG